MAEDFPPVVFENQVRFAETDLQGIVFFGTFFTYMDETFNAFCREIGMPYSGFDGWTTHIAHAELDYHGQATFEDVLENGIRIASFGNASLTAEYAARKKADGSPVARGEVVHVAVDAETDEVVRVPEGFRETVAAFQDTPPE